MKSFISSVIEDVQRKHQSFNNLIFVLPSQRACVFLKEEIVEKSKSASFLPKITSIENYIQDLANINLIDATQLLFEFYDIYQQNVPKENRELFDAFSQWATIALHDFNEIDSYLVNTKQFFSNLKDVKKLEEWFQDKKPSQLAINYLQFFEHLAVLYEALYDKLKKNKFGYQGLIYKEATKNLSFYIENNKNSQFIFVGFNALNKAEETIFQELLNHNLATIYWDANESFFNKSNEAGVFLRKYKKEWPYYQKNDFLWKNKEDTTSKNIHLIGAPKNITQIKFAGELLAKMDNFNKTALVLADENLLTLTLNSLPNNVKNINITMGYPLKDIPLASLFDALFKLHLNQQKFNKETDQLFYYKDVLSVLNNPFLNKLNGKILQKLMVEVKSKNSIFLSVEMLKKYISQAEATEISTVFSLFYLPTSINDVIKQFLNLIKTLKNHTEGVEKEYLYRFFTIFQQLETLNITYSHITNLKSLNQFYTQILRIEKLSFRGEPLEGLQLMGMLETRALDFETVIITSVNEGILPGGKNDFSFVPYDVKKYFELPTYQEKDAIFSYHFQRLLQRAKNIFLMYNTESDGYGSGEKSRFLTQIEINYPNCTKTIVSPKVQQTKFPILQIEKTPEMMRKLREVFTKGISPSALATYIYNPIKFYEQRVLEIYEEDEVEETIAANTMGSVIHEVLEEMYNPFLNAFLSKENIAEMQKITFPLLVKYFEKHYEKGNIQTGKNKLIFEVCKNHIKRFLNQELQMLNQNKQLKIIALEKELSAKIKVEGIHFPIKLKGIVDRIDELDGVTRIIDYKTGKVLANDLKISDFSVLGSNYKYTKALQVMIYSFLFSEENGGNFSNLVEAGIISFKNLNSGFLKMNFSEKKGANENFISPENMDAFLIELKRIIVEILNPEVPFTQNQNLPF